MRRLILLLGAGSVVGLIVWMFAGQESSRSDRATRADETTKNTGRSDSSHQDVPPAEEVFPLHGVVRDESGEPIAGVSVTVLTDSGEASTERTWTGSDGRFQLTAANTSLHRIRIFHPAYVVVETWVAVDVEHEFVLAAGVRFTVIVIDPTGAPVRGATVRATRDMNRHPLVGWSWSSDQALAKSISDEEGRAFLGALPPGEIQLVATHPKFARSRGEYVISTREPVEHRMPLNAGGILAGVVFDPSGDPLAGVAVVAGERETITDKTGAYRLERVGAGFVTVEATHDEYGPGFFGDRLGWANPVPVEVLIGVVSDGIDVHLGAASWISGRVVDGKGKPIANANVNGSAWPGFPVGAAADTGKDGRFRLGPYTLKREAVAWGHVSAPGYKSAELPNQSIKAGESHDYGDIRLTKGAVLRGKCVDADGEPVQGANVQIVPSFRSARTERDGTFAIVGATNGDFVIGATLSVVGRSLASAHEKLKVEGNQDVSGLVLTLVPPLTIAGTVTAGNGLPRTEVTMLARNRAHAYLSSYAETDENGQYTFTNLAPGQYDVGVLGFGRTWVTFDETFAKGIQKKQVDAGARNLDFVYPFTGGIVTAVVTSRKDGTAISSFQFAVIRYRAFLPTVVDAGNIENKDGEFRFEFDNEGTWALEFSAEGRAPFRTGKLKLKKGEALDLGTIRLGEGGTLEGEVVDAQGVPVPYARINILSLKMETNEHEPFTGRDGRFTVSRIAPGMYMAFAVSPAHPIGIAKNLRLIEGKTTKTRIQFAPAAPLEVFVKHPDGRPLSGARLYWSFPEIAPLTSKMVSGKIPPGYGSNVSGEDGRILQHALPAGPVTLFLEAKGFTPVKRGVKLKVGETTRVQIKMTAKK